MKKYKYIGDGAGIPGLPHEVSDEEADALGVSVLLAEAVQNGKYVEVEAGDSARSSRPVKKVKVESEVNNGQQIS